MGLPRKEEQWQLAGATCPASPGTALTLDNRPYYPTGIVEEIANPTANGKLIGGPGVYICDVCYAFDNAYLELVWVEDWDEITSPAVERTRLAERAEWQSYRASPFGIAVRGGGLNGALPFATWDYAAPFGATLPVAA